MAETRKLTLHIDGKRITAERFKRAVDAFYALIQEVTEEVAGEKNAVEWIVSAKPGSVNLGYAGEGRKASVDPTVIVNAVYSGFRELTRKEAVRPAYFNDTALEKTRELGRVRDGKAVSALQVRRSTGRASVNDKVVHNVNAILGGAALELGTIEGRIEMISARGAFHFNVYEALSDHPVRCNVSPEYKDQMMKAFQKRVAVSGMIKYSATGEPASIDVGEIEIFPEGKDLPSAAAVYGILAKL